MVNQMKTRRLFAPGGRLGVSSAAAPPSNDPLRSVVTTWAAFCLALSAMTPGLVVVLESTEGVVCTAKVNRAGTACNFVDWIDICRASALVNAEMWTEITGIAPTFLTPHATTGGMVLNVNANSISCIGLNDLQFDGSDRGVDCEFVWDTVDDASMATNSGFAAGFRAIGVANNSTTLRSGGLVKSSTNSYRPSYCFDRIDITFSSSNGTAISAGTVANGVVVTTFYTCRQNGNIASGTGNAGADYGGARVVGQTAGTAIAAANNTNVHTDRTDLQVVIANGATDGTNVIRARRIKVNGDFVVV